MNKIKYNLDIVDKEILVIFLHGYKGDKDEFKFLRNWITEEMHLSYYSLTYGKRDKNNQISTLEKIIDELKIQINKIQTRYNFKKIIIYGYSLGAAISVKLIGTKLVKCHGLILHGIFDDRAKLLKKRKIILPKKDNIKPIELISKISNIPVVFLHGSSDQSIKPDLSHKVFMHSNNRLKSIYLTAPMGHNINNKSAKVITNYLKFIFQELDFFNLKR